MAEYIPLPLADDLLKGSDAIGGYLGISGDRALKLIKRKIVTAFKLGGIWHARRSTLRADIERLERERGLEAHTLCSEGPTSAPKLQKMGVKNGN